MTYSRIALVDENKILSVKTKGLMEGDFRPYRKGESAFPSDMQRTLKERMKPPPVLCSFCTLEYTYSSLPHAVMESKR